MKPNISANLALALILIGWFLMASGYLMSIRDFGRDTPGDWQAAYYARATLVTGAGLAVAALSLWLSGFAFHGARRRAIAIAILFFLPFAVVVIGFARNAF